MTPGLQTRRASQGPARPRASPGKGNSPLPSDRIIKCNHFRAQAGAAPPSQHIPWEQGPGLSSEGTAYGRCTGRPPAHELGLNSDPTAHDCVPLTPRHAQP